ncbi:MULTISPECIES: MFS transporter [Halorubrum]|uniref:MFS transporter n=1 Tax=Halorubrum ezzemoulense TaxID=337243 RepID=A0A256JQD1_HALEZ|nr:MULTISPECIES: MFS transporter [Halorubrum]MDB2260122.1 MFS transporter [Halorubrum ezzemoulense]MDB2266644.1 MFS transporter [Halorubrum ezzemoulense]MDB2281533.1 MFS transporter [Halorubrum ezzemoulense]MDB9278629.1 MFS transporter [Halorubrum ezzemoulense]MDB9282171.1 MFS transporter [Halorubrum ezzemoulense]
MSAGGDDADAEADSGALDGFRRLFALERDVFVLSIAMFAFSLGFQMTNRYLPEYMVALGASGFVVGLFGTFGNVISAIYPYPGGAVSDRIGSRYALTLFGLLSTLGFLVWLVAPGVGPIAVGGLIVEPWVWVFVGLVLAQAWKSFGLGATFAVVKQATDPSRLAAGFASTETFRRTAFLVGPVLAAVLIGLRAEFTVSFQFVLAVAVAFGVLGTLVQHVLYDASGDSFGDSFAGLDRVRRDLREMPAPLRPLLVGDTLVRFANGMVYVFFVLVVTQFFQVGLDATVALGGFAYDVDLSPQAFFGYLLGVEMLVALLIMVPASRLAERIGLKPVVAVGFAVYALFPVVLIYAPALAGSALPLSAVMIAVFAFSGLRFAGLPSHKALIVGPAEQGAGGRVTGTYYLVRNTVVIPSAAVGGYLWDFVSPEVAFTVAAVVGLVGTGYFLAFGKEFEAYA